MNTKGPGLSAGTSDSLGGLYLIEALVQIAVKVGGALD